MSDPRRTLPGEPMAFYLANVDRETDECILWPYAKHNLGYGQLSFGHGTRKYVHRLSCERHHGPPSSELPEAGHLPVVCHTPACFNGRHLRWISRKQQSLDRKQDGTFHDGVRHVNSKLTWDQVNEIRTMYALGGITQAKLALKYGIHQSKIWKIVTLRSYTTR